MAQERMSGVDTAWLRMDSPVNRMAIVGVWVFEQVMPFEPLACLLRERLLTFDRFRQRVRTDALGTWWVDDESFDLSRHLVIERLPDPDSEQDLQRLAGRLISRPLARNRPLWQFHLIEHYRGASALITRIHHCIGDGVALVGVMLSLSDATHADQLTTLSARHALPGMLPDTLPAEGHDDLAHTLGAMVEPLQRRAARALATTGLPAVGARVLRDALAIALMTRDSPTRLRGKPGRRKVVAWNDPLPLATVSAVSHVLGVSVNDVLLSCVAGALRRYLAGRGEPTEGIELRAMVPVNLRAGTAEPRLGNRFGLVPLVLPVGLANPLARLREIGRRMAALKGGYQAPLAYALLSAVGEMPPGVQTAVLGYLASKATAVMTNVPGPAQPLQLAGRTVCQLMFWVPQSGDVGMGVSVFSYRGGVQFGLMTDAVLCPDPQQIIAGFAPEFDRLVCLLALLPRDELAGGLPDPWRIEQQLFGPPHSRLS